MVTARPDAFFSAGNYLLNCDKICCYIYLQYLGVLCKHLDNISVNLVIFQSYFLTCRETKNDGALDVLLTTKI